MHQDALKVQQILDQELTVEEVAKRLTGRKGGLRPSKPKGDGVVQYLWRWARFHSGADVSLPMTADWDLWDGLKYRGLERDSYLVTDRQREIENLLQEHCDKVMLRMGLNPFRGAFRWGRALGQI